MADEKKDQKRFKSTNFMRKMKTLENYFQKRDMEKEKDLEWLFTSDLEVKRSYLYKFHPKYTGLTVELAREHMQVPTFSEL